MENMINAVSELRVSEGMVPPAPHLNHELKMLDRDRQQDGMVATYALTKKNRKRYVACAKCHRTFRKWACENGHQFAVGQESCGSRLCPHCAHYRAGILVGRLNSFLFNAKGKPARDLKSMRYAVLTVRNTRDLLAGFLLIWEAWTRMRRSALWKRYVDGSMVVFEVTFSAATRWHPHLNLLLDGKFFPVEALHQAWMEATKGAGQIVFIKPVTAGTAREVVKYVCKSSDLIGQPDAVDEFHAVLDGRRLVRTYGTFYPLPVNDEEKLGVQCPVCPPGTACVQLGYCDPRQLRMDPLFLSADKYGVAESPPEEVARYRREAAEFNPWLQSPRWKVRSSLENAMDRMLQPAKDALIASRQALWDDYLSSGGRC